jgi:hypothetical protein
LPDKWKQKGHLFFKLTQVVTLHVLDDEVDDVNELVISFVVLEVI